MLEFLKKITNITACDYLAPGYVPLGIEDKP